MPFPAMRRLFLLFLAVAGSGVSLRAEGENPSPDRWRGLILDQSTPTDARARLGEPKEEKTDRIYIASVDKWFTKDQKNKEFTILKFKGLEGMKNVELAFRDGKLIQISLQPKEGISPNAIGRIYGIEFSPLFSKIGMAFNPHDYERHEGKVYPKKYPSFYDLVGVSRSSVIVCGVDNSSWGSMFKSMAGLPDAGVDFPGKITYVQLNSRSLENRDGEDALR